MNSLLADAVVGRGLLALLCSAAFTGKRTFVTLASLAPDHTA